MGISHEAERLPRDSNAKVDGNVTVEARQGTEREHSLSLGQAVKMYPSAIGWSLYFSLGVRLFVAYGESCD
jgi:hypothetical protein